MSGYVNRICIVFFRNTNVILQDILVTVLLFIATYKNRQVFKWCLAVTSSNHVSYLLSGGPGLECATVTFWVQNLIAKWALYDIYYFKSLLLVVVY